MDDATVASEKQHYAELLRQHLKAAKHLRQQANDAPAAARHRLLVREWQAGRLARTHADLLASARFGRAAQFFLSDLYGPKDFSSRDEEVERILPLLIKMLPASALCALALAVELDALSEELDSAMVAELCRAGLIECIDEGRLRRGLPRHRRPARTSAPDSAHPRNRPDARPTRPQAPAQQHAQADARPRPCGRTRRIARVSRARLPRLPRHGFGERLPGLDRAQGRETAGQAVRRDRRPLRLALGYTL
jgi:hypothetical protein